MTSPCRRCPTRLKQTCNDYMTEPCRELERLLPAEDGGRYGKVNPASAFRHVFPARISRETHLGNVRAVLDTLTGKDRDIAERYCWLGQSGEQIAAALHISQQAVSKRLRRLKARL